ncbi:uncharacterized protein NPIL_163801 [Nephila pilipes]|uniref:Uncharacterized protein n=1 Tax=Nephila pilipes TaxID=299642 RepID=A0A8X6UV20_NEPPI|nr:uncharacterized protein NPIL_163801 [Nephila pilipes]
MAQLRQEQLDDTRAERNEVMRLEQRQSHSFTVNRRRANDQQRQQAHRALLATSFLRLAFQYEPDIEYYAHSKVEPKQTRRIILTRRIIMRID